MKHRPIRIMFAFLILSVILSFSACRSTKKRKKKCDCPTWSYMIGNEKIHPNGTSIQKSII